MEIFSSRKSSINKNLEIWSNIRAIYFGDHKLKLFIYAFLLWSYRLLNFSGITGFHRRYKRGMLGYLPVRIGRMHILS